MRFLDRLTMLSRRQKRFVLMINDAALLALAMWLSFSVRLGALYWPENVPFLLFLASFSLVGVFAFDRFGLYRLVTRYVGPSGIRRILYAMTAAVFIWGLVSIIWQPEGLLPRSVFILLWLFGIGLVIGSRQFFAWQLQLLRSDSQNAGASTKKVLIYGAGAAGNLLAKELQQAKNYTIVAFVDSDLSLWGQKIRGIKVREPSEIEMLVRERGVQEVLLAIPSVSHQQRREIVKSMEPFSVAVKTVPSVAEIASGQVAVSDIRPISAEDLLGREPVPPYETLISRDIQGKSVFITGAGGSIGSELARQVLRIGPKKLVLFERSEIALYDIEMAIREEYAAARLAGQPGATNGHAVDDIEILGVLGSINDESLVRRTLKSNEVQTIYHAAAYKHVPIVESNPVVGIRNNCFGTLTLVKVADELHIPRFVLISTDKAVRPTNIMGASKRLAELVLQAYAARPDRKTVFTMVRFGNVLDSSGSVVRLFTKQIEAGGPVTVTDPKIVRYFMSIPEAAQLVIQAGAMASGGDVFVLDMGEPVKIEELARLMIQLSGLKVDDGTGGDIAITYTGLRPGEKLYEELLISGDVIETEHPRIMRSNEPALAYDELMQCFERLKYAMAANDIDAIRSHLAELVAGYRPEKALN